jgi:hypothetical protein
MPYYDGPNDLFPPLDPLLSKTQLYPGARPGFGLQDAHDMALGRARQTASPRMGMPQVDSPFTNSINSAKKMAAMTLMGDDLGDDEKAQIEVMANDPGISLKDFESATRVIRQQKYFNEKQAAKQPVQHGFDQPDQPQGSISITPNDPGDEQFMAGQARVAKTLGEGETMTPNEGGGYTVAGGALNAQPTTKPDAIVGLYNSVAQRLTPEQQAQWKATAQAGASVQQLDDLIRQMTRPPKITAEQSFNVKSEAQRYQLSQVEKELKELSDMFPGFARGSQISIANHPEQAARFKALVQQQRQLLQQIQNIGYGGQQQQMSGDQSSVKQQAIDAIRRGASKAAVLQRLQQFGIDTSGI